MDKPILCLDFDGVIHSYTSGWKGADKAVDPPVPGAMEFICAAMGCFTLHVFSSRSHQEGGIGCMRDYIREHLYRYSLDQTPRAITDKMHAEEFADNHIAAIHFPNEKPPAMISLDDRAITFVGTWPILTDLLTFKPWNKRV